MVLDMLRINKENNVEYELTCLDMKQSRVNFFFLFIFFYLLIVIIMIILPKA